MTEPIPEDYYLKPIEPEDNLPSYKQIETKLAYANHDIKSLREQLAKERENLTNAYAAMRWLEENLLKERELRKELVDTLKSVHKGTTFMHDDIELILQKAKE